MYRIFLDGASFVSDLIDGSVVNPLIVVYSGPFQYQSLVGVKTINSFRAIGVPTGATFESFGEFYFE